MKLVFVVLVGKQDFMILAENMFCGFNQKFV